MGVSDFPASKQIIDYYDKKALYSQLTQNYNKAVEREKANIERFLRNYTFLNSVSFDIKINAKKGLFPIAEVATDYTINIPKFVGYIGLKDKIIIKAKSISNVTKPSEFIRNVDIAVDLSSFFLEKLGDERWLKYIFKQTK